MLGFIDTGSARDFLFVLYFNFSLKVALSLFKILIIILDFFCFFFKFFTTFIADVVETFPFV